MNDGARAAAAAAGTPPTQDGAAAHANKRRFAPEEGNVSFAVARGLLPAGAWRLTLVVLLGLLATAGVIAGDYFSAAVSPHWRRLLILASPASVGQWLISSLMLVVGALCFVVYGLRSTRTDDVRGLCRWWFAAGAAVIAAGAAFSTQAPVVAAQHLTQATGFGPLGGALWWLAPSTIAFVVLVLRPLGDLSESKLSLAFTVLAITSLAASAVAAVGLTPAAWAAVASEIAYGGLLLALVAGGAAQLLYVRRVLLETDGVIAAPAPRVKRSRTKADDKASEREGSQPSKLPKAETTSSPPKTGESKPEPKPAPAQAAKPQAKQTQWTDGSDSDDASYDDESPRKLTKAERKKLRREKARRYAA